MAVALYVSPYFDVNNSSMKFEKKHKENADFIEFKEIWT